MKSRDVYGLGNGIVDVLVEVTEEEFSDLQFEKGTMGLLEGGPQAELLERFSDRKRQMVSGGSVANSLVLLGQLGAKAAFSCKLADDPYGLHYKSEFEALEIELPNPLHVGEKSGTSAILITPDAERTMRTCLGVSGTFSAEDIDEGVLRDSKWVFLEGYLFCNPEQGQSAIRRAIQLAKEHGTKIAVTLSDAWIVAEFRDAVEAAVKDADLVFANEEEAKALAEAASGADAVEKLSSRAGTFAITMGAQGATLLSDGEAVHVPARSVTPVDLTGAGDAFAGSLLYSLLQELPPQQGLAGSNALASEVIQRIGARLSGNVQELWNASVS
ncbi:adenosine kinase [bacterium]|nr:adenosine kinase [bacterium]